MKLLSRLFEPLRHAAAAFFKHDIAIRRDADSGMRLVLEQRPAKKSKKPSREDVARHKEHEELALMRSQLTELLDSLPQTRSAMRHLAFVEHALAKKGMKALHKLPLDVLQPALTQLEGLVTNWSPVGLANLRSKMAVAIIDREHADPDAEADAYRTAAVLDHAPADEAPVAEQRSDDEALAAAYAALGSLAPLQQATPSDAGPPSSAEGVEMVGELGSRSAKAVAREAARPAMRGAAPDITLRQLEPH
jgi:hypothetical protein